MSQELIGMRSGILNEKYHAMPGYSSTDLVKMCSRGFGYWKWAKDNPKPPTDSMAIGSATHLLLESGLTFDIDLVDQLAIYPEGSNKTKGFRDFKLENIGKICIDHEDYTLAKRMAEKVLNTPEIRQFFEKGVCEASIWANYPGTETLVKCRPDFLRVDDGISINFKTSFDSSERGFLQSIQAFGYDISSAFYCDILQAHFGRNFDEIHVVAEKNYDEPIRVGIYTIDDESLEFARSQYRQIIARIPECESTGIWPENPIGVQSVKVPFWAQKIVTL